MMTAILPGLTATALFISTTLAPTTATATQSSQSPLPLTRLLPEDNVVGHTVLAGETLGTIAQDYYKDSSYWTTLWNDNPWVADPDHPEEGSLLNMRGQKSGKPEQLTQKLQGRNDALVQKKNEAYMASIGYTSANRAYIPSNPLPVVTTAPTPAAQESYDSVYQQAGARFGVPWQILYGIHMTETGGRSGAISSGYGTGAQGPMQFMPATFNAYAVDGDGDGKANINDVADAIFTAADFLARHGSLMNGLKAYGGNTSGVLILAREKGFSQ